MLTLRLKTLLGILVTAFLLTGAGAAGATTISLLHMDGTPGSQTFTDETGKGWTAAGDAQISAAQAKWGQSAYFDGTSDYLVANDSSYFFPGTQTFTIDFWIYPLAGGNHAYLAGMSNPNGGQGYDIRLNGSDIWVVGVNGWDVNIAPNNDSVTLNTWHHIALSCTADTAYLFVDGVLQGTSPRSDMSWPSSTSFQIGYQANFGGENYSGYMDEFRYSDVALWTANFTPPTAPAPLPASVLLLGSGLLGLGLLKRRRRI